MLIPGQTATMRWHSKNKAWYESFGYQFTGMGKVFQVNPDHLPKNSHAIVRVQCDYCKKVYELSYRDYLKGCKNGKSCCSQCQPIRSKETCLERYGVPNVFMDEGVKLKVANTVLQKYGIGNIAHTPVVAEKIRQTNLRKYGVPYSTQAPSVIKKMRKSLSEHGTVPRSRPEIALCKSLKEIYGEENCVENYAYDALIFDCLVRYKERQFDVEYDGIYWHRERIENDRKRNYFLLRRGFWVLRFRGEQLPPSNQQIIDAFNHMVVNNKRLYIVNLIP